LQQYHESTGPSLRRAIALLEKAVSKDPNFVRAYASLALCWGRMAEGGYEDLTLATETAERAARKAVELGPDWAETHAALAAVSYYVDRLLDVQTEAKKAIQINPNLSEAYNFLGMNHVAFGRLNEGLPLLRKAYELDPLSFSGGYSLGLTSALLGREKEALEVLSRLKELNPGSPRVYAGLSEFYMLRRDFPTAQDLLNAGLRVNPKEFRLLLNEGLLYAFTDRRKEALEVLDEISLDKSESVRIYGRQFIHSALGNLDEAFKALMEGAERHVWSTFILNLPVFEQVRRDARFSKFCTKVGLPTQSE
jgi:tetratricopeptide (TPR) repeat protein